VAVVYEEVCQAMHASIARMSWGVVQQESSVTYACLSEDDFRCAEQMEWWILSAIYRFQQQIWRVLIV
jgi:hypothetical protein